MTIFISVVNFYASCKLSVHCHDSVNIRDICQDELLYSYLNCIELLKSNNFNNGYLFKE